MYLHFVTDSVYMQRFIEENERISPNNLYLFLGNSEDIKYLEKNKLRILSFPNNTNIFIYLIQYIKLLIKCINLMKKSERVYFHFLQKFHCILLFLTKKICSYWLVWGADLYNRIDYDLYDNQTKQIIKFPQNKFGMKTKIGKLIESLGIKKITYIGTIIKGDYKLISETFGISDNRIDFCYANPIKFNESIISEENDRQVRKILVGNSGDPTNNHFSIFDALSDFTDIEIICPLSYGNEAYINQVISYGKEKFGRRFVPITSFLEQSEYQNLLSNITIGIFNHYRQQALGNIFALLVLGKKVYVNEKSPAYSFFIENKIKIENTENIIQKREIDFIPYSKDLIKKNRQIILSFHSKEKSLEYIKNLYM